MVGEVGREALRESHEGHRVWRSGSRSRKNISSCCNSPYTRRGLGIACLFQEKCAPDCVEDVGPDNHKIFIR
jgi:hypothetical protein